MSFMSLETVNVLKVQFVFPRVQFMSYENPQFRSQRYSLFPQCAVYVLGLQFMPQ